LAIKDFENYLLFYLEHEDFIDVIRVLHGARDIPEVLCNPEELLFFTPGVYNIVDSDPSELSIWLPTFAAFVRAPEPPRVSEADALHSAGLDLLLNPFEGRFEHQGKRGTSLRTKETRGGWPSAVPARESVEGFACGQLFFS
jgi:hypothetical protein